jgi:hypothetical protein
VKFGKGAASKQRSKTTAAEEPSETAPNKRDRSGRRPSGAAEGGSTRNAGRADDGHDELKALRANNGSKASVLSKSSAKSSKGKNTLLQRAKTYAGKQKTQRERSQPAEGRQSSPSQQTASEDEAEEPRLKGIRLIEQELSELIAPKYEKLKQKCQAEIKEQAKFFKMNGNECIEMQMLVQHAIGTKLSSDDYMGLYVSDIDEFF